MGADVTDDTAGADQGTPLTSININIREMAKYQATPASLVWVFKIWNGLYEDKILQNYSV